MVSLSFDLMSYLMWPCFQNGTTKISRVSVEKPGSDQTLCAQGMSTHMRGPTVSSTMRSTPVLPCTSPLVRPLPNQCHPTTVSNRCTWATCLMLCHCLAGDAGNLEQLAIPMADQPGQCPAVKLTRYSSLFWLQSLSCLFLLWP